MDIYIYGVYIPEEKCDLPTINGDFMVIYQS